MVALGTLLAVAAPMAARAVSLRGRSHQRVSSAALVYANFFHNLQPVLGADRISSKIATKHTSGW